MDKYELVKNVGRGAFGTVYLCQRKADEKSVIIKQIPVDQFSQEEKDSSLNESRILSLLDHPNVISYYESFIADNTMMIVMEYAPGGTLYEFLRERKDELLPETTILKLFSQIVLGLNHIHSLNIVHRDLKTPNIMLTANKTIVKIGDFGISKILMSKSNASTTVGTPCYISPEIVRKAPYNTKSDIWALGCVLYEIVTLRKAFEAEIMKGNPSAIAPRYSSRLQQLIDDMLHLDARKRPSTSELMAYPMLSGPIMDLYTDVGMIPCTSRSTQNVPGLGCPTSVNTFHGARPKGSREKHESPLGNSSDSQTDTDVP